LQPGDVPDTYANIEDLRNDFDFNPQTPISEGIDKFIRWYRNYYPHEFNS